ncbi:MAG: ABC transporter substrate-binding protein [Paludibacteraceae bacterium]|nr:ABC transporter substrate-binding protein [Paludibacteraceae bacterium]
MKKTLFAVCFALLTVLGFAADRQHTLKIYNWADYIEPKVLDDFKVWYKNLTGEDIEIIYNTFDINESMLTQIEIGKEDYDLICPSEYIIERMLKKNLLQPIQRNLVPDTLQYFDNVAPFVVDKFQQMSSDKVVSDFTVGYMWGTTGFLYNPQFVKEEELDSWGAILNPRFKDRIFMKDAFRDVYSVIVLYAYYNDILSQDVTRDELVQNLTQERIDSVERILINAKDQIAGWEVDFGKEEMVKGKTWMNLSWSGDAQWAINEAAESGLELKYTVPKEGTNVWFDGWCIPVYAKNVKAATFFIDFMCRPDIALRNMDEIGYVSVIGTPEILEAIEDSTEWPEPLDLTYFFGEDATAIHANPVLYADRSVVDRAALMHDAAEQTEAMLKMWSHVKGDNLSVGIVAFFALLVVVLIGFIVVRSINNRKRTRRR